MKFLKIPCFIAFTFGLALGQANVSTPSSGSSDLSDEIKQLRTMMAEQQKAMVEQQKQLADQQRELEKLRLQLGTQPEPAAAKSTDGQAADSRSADNLIEPRLVNTNLTAPASAASITAESQINNETPPNSEVSPLQFKIGSAYITPVGFIDFTGVWRSRDGGSGIGTNFAGIPYGGASNFQTNLSEFRFSMQNSRIGFRIDEDLKGSHVIGYMEADFLGNNPGNVAVSSNSNTLRSRLYWVDVRKGPWELLGGQSWSLVTPNRAGVSPLPGDVFFSYNMDTNYQVGMVWGRIPELRLAYHLPDDKAAFAIALDAPEQYGGGTNGAGSVIYPAALSATLTNGELNNGNSTLAVPNKAPDVIAKFVLDPSKRLHFEVGGLARFFQLYNPLTASHFSATGGAGFVNLDVGVWGGLRLLTHNYWGDGGGRYIFGQVPDLIVRVDGSPSLLHAGSTVDGIEYSHKSTTLFGYWGLVYSARSVTTDVNGCLIGYGFSASPSSLKGCTAPQSAQNRSIQEATVGFIQSFWKDPKYGALSLIGQYSYLTRNPWAIATGSPRNAIANMAFIDLRYTLPGSAPTLGKPGRE